jgi:octaprenyl-diphosphate synthase
MTELSTEISMAHDVDILEDEVMTPLTQFASDNGHENLSNHLNELHRWIGFGAGALDAELAQIQAGPHASLAQTAAAYLIAQPGKRIRPLCVTLSAALGNRGNHPAVSKLAAAAELVHNATLLHDDVIDEGTQRRGIDAARVVYGNSISILAGDHMLLEALKLVESTGLSVIEFLNIITEIVTAEAWQLEARTKFDPSRERYLKVIGGKTASLFRWSLMAGGQIGELTDEQVVSLGAAGDALGNAFQLVDDLLDIGGDVASIGKDAMQDLREGKLTWPLLIGAERDEELSLKLRAIVSDHSTKIDDDTANWIVNKLKETKAINDTIEFAKEQGELALSHLENMPQGGALDALRSLIHATMARAES